MKDFYILAKPTPIEHLTVKCIDVVYQSLIEPRRTNALNR
jgi:hypothetical protein